MVIKKVVPYEKMIYVSDNDNPQIYYTKKVKVFAEFIYLDHKMLIHYTHLDNEKITISEAISTDNCLENKSYFSADMAVEKFILLFNRKKVTKNKLIFFIKKHIEASDYYFLKFPVWRNLNRL